jgi:hypothetical protein
MYIHARVVGEEGLQYVAVPVAQWLKPCLEIGFDVDSCSRLIANAEPELVQITDGATNDPK